MVIGDESVTDFPAVWTDRAFGNFAGTFIPNTIVLFAILAVAFGVLLHATPFGRSVYAIGANEEAAYFAGLRVKRIKLILFVLCEHGRRARRRRHLAAQLDRRRQRRPWASS